MAAKVKHYCLPKWRARIDKAEERGSFNAEDYELAAGWSACAVGEARVRYKNLVKLLDDGDPEDVSLDILGFDFFKKVRWPNGDAFGAAREIIDKIEKRLAEIDAAR